MADIRQALAAASGPGVAARGRTALVIGNVGQLGEELLHAALECPRYSRVAVGMRKGMRTVMSGLDPVILPGAVDGWDPVPALGRVPDDLYICIEMPKASFWKLPNPYVEVTSEQAVGLASRLRAAGTQCLAVVTPLEAMAQIGLESMIRNTDEIRLVEAGFRRLVIVRPSVEERAVASRGVLDAVAGTVLRSLRGVMTPKRLQPVRRREAARIVVDAMESLGDGVHIIGAARLREIAGEPLG
jgi:hypothetical protein